MRKPMAQAAAVAVAVGGLAGTSLAQDLLFPFNMTAEEYKQIGNLTGECGAGLPCHGLVLILRPAPGGLTRHATDIKRTCARARMSGTA